VKAALSAMTVKTDRRDARGIAQLIRMGWFRSVHCKSTGLLAISRPANTLCGQFVRQHEGFKRRQKLTLGLDHQSQALQPLGN
jgi:hypothetical protein